MSVILDGDAKIKLFELVCKVGGGRVYHTDALKEHTWELRKR